MSNDVNSNHLRFILLASALMLGACAQGITPFPAPEDEPLPPSEAPPVEEPVIEDPPPPVVVTPPVVVDDPPADPLPSKCSATEELVTCPFMTTEMLWREVHYQVPQGTPPLDGWPVVLLLQGSFFSAELTWTADRDMPFGAYYQTMVVKRLLDDGYAVITPEAHLGGALFWDTNQPPWIFGYDWTTAPDHDFMMAIFQAIEAGVFGELDPETMFATGVSSGGYMSSRLAIEYPNRFLAIAIQSASYMTCANLLCVIPDLEPDHVPVLFLHGTSDIAVPYVTMQWYEDALIDADVETRIVLVDGAGHGWVEPAPDEVVAWFDEYR